MRTPLDRLNDATKAYEGLVARRTVLAESLVTLEERVGQAKYRVSLKPEVDDVLLTLQTRNHQRTVGMYEALLTQIMQEVLPNESKAISMDLGTGSGLPSLDILVSRNPDGQREDILTGNGGSVANVVSAGLRFIALSRTKMRKFIVLDEADCWLAPSRVESFANVVAQMGTDLGVQSLMISHHDTALFSASASSIVALSNEGGVIDANYVYDLGTPPTEGQIEFIRLVNFMSHEDTTIPLSAGLTAIIGGNDIGKSAVVTAIAALSGARPFKKEYVRHGASSGSVSIGLVGGQVIECTRNVKGSPAVVYCLLGTRGEVIHESPVAQPDWLDGILGIHTEGGLDIQIGDQKKPVFLLDESGSKQAAILSIGRESSLIADMQAEYKKRLNDDKQIIKQGEADVLTVRAQLAALEGLPSAALALSIARGTLAQTTSLSSDIALLAPMQEELQRAQQRHGGSAGLAQLPVLAEPLLQSTGWLTDTLPLLSRLERSARIEPPSALGSKVTLRDAAHLSEVLKGMARAKEMAHTKAPALVLVVPQLEDSGALAQVCTALSTRRVGDIRALPPAPVIPMIRDVAQVAALEQAIANTADVLNTERGTLKTAQAAHKAGEVEYRALVDSLGGVCPLCSNTFKGHVHAH